MQDSAKIKVANAVVAKCGCPGAACHIRDIAAHCKWTVSATRNQLMRLGRAVIVDRWGTVTRMQDRLL